MLDGMGSCSQSKATRVLLVSVCTRLHDNLAKVVFTAGGQVFVVCELHEKMDVLWAFIKSHLQVCPRPQACFCCCAGLIRQGPSLSWCSMPASIIITLCQPSNINQLCRVVTEAEPCSLPYGVAASRVRPEGRRVRAGQDSGVPVDVQASEVRV